MPTKVSIIIPMYNEERYIARCLDSLKLQSYKDFELILIDDGSKDATVKIAEGYEKDFDLTILKQKNSGPGKARNRGAKEAKGDILMFVDADMYFDKEYINVLISPIEKNKEIGTCHGTELVGNLENPIARAYGIIRGKYDPNHTRSNIYRAIKKKPFLDSGGFDYAKGYFYDDLSKINNGKGSLVIEHAICYHNNPEKLGEVLKHSIWVGKGLMQSGAFGDYLYKYRKRIIAFIALMIPIITLSIYFKKIRQSILIPILLLLLLIYVKSIIRAIKEKHISHLIYIPIIIITRGIGYMIGVCKMI